MEAAILGLIRYSYRVDPHGIEGVDLLRDAQDRRSPQPWRNLPGP